MKSRVTVNLGCQLDWVWYQLRDKALWACLQEGLTGWRLSGGSAFWWGSDVKGSGRKGLWEERALLAHVPLIAARGSSTCYYQTRLPRRPALWTESLWGSQPLQSADSQFGYAACTVQNRLKKSPQWCPLPPISYVPLGYSKTRRFLSVFFCKNANPFYLGRALIV